LRLNYSAVIKNRHEFDLTTALYETIILIRILIWRFCELNKTFSAKKESIERCWYIVDAEDKVLGRLASEVAKVLRGKHKPIYTPHVDTGDHVVVINANKVRLTGNKLEKKVYYRHSGYPGGIKSTTAKELLEKKPEAMVEKAVRGMLPKNRLGRAMFKKLKVYAADEHPHQAQRPVPLEF
jgi:large subunit ribosomal protein L13